MTSSPGYWDAQADSFDDQPDHGLREPSTRTAWRRLLLDHLPVPPEDVVDLGCGTGSLAVLLASEGFRVRGLDVSPQMAAAARAKAEAAGIPVEIDVGDAAVPPNAEGAAGVVLARGAASGTSRS